MPEIRNALISTNNEEIVKHNTPVKSAFGNLTRSNNKVIITGVPEVGEIKEPKRKGRPRKVKVEDPEGTHLDYSITTNEPYIDSYDDVNTMLKFNICQIDSLQKELKEEFDNLRLARQTKGRFQYLNDIAATINSLASTKVSAIGKLESIITTAHKMEISRAKDLKLDVSGDDNNAIIGLYESIINTPREQLTAGGFMPPVLEGGTMALMAQPQEAYNIMNAPTYMPNQDLSPEQNRMIVENNPNVKTVVVYNKRDESRRFAMRDMSTGQYLDNVALPDEFLLEDMTINLATETARNANVNMNFPLIVVGDISGSGGFGGNY